MQKILASSGSFPSAKNIREYIRQETGIKFPIITNRVGRANVDSVIFRYGNTIPSNRDTETNSVNFIEMCRRKNLFSDFCIANNIFAPVFHTDGIPENFPVVIRSTLTGFGGQGISFATNVEEFQRKFHPGYWWTDFVACQYELRVHLFTGHENPIYKIYKKIATTEEDNLPVRNLEHGYHFSLRTVENYQRLIPIMQNFSNLIHQVGGKFCAVDLGWNRERQEYFFFEGNSAPGLNAENIAGYGNYLMEILEIRR